jgi:hypothetical protein
MNYPVFSEQSLYIIFNVYFDIDNTLSTQTTNYILNLCSPRSPPSVY